MQRLETQKCKFKQSMQDMKEEAEKKELSIRNECKLTLTKLLDDKQQAHLQSLCKKEKAHEQTLHEKEHLLCAKYKSFHNKKWLTRNYLVILRKNTMHLSKILKRNSAAESSERKAFDRLKVLQNCFSNSKERDSGKVRAVIKEKKKKHH